MNTHRFHRFACITLVSLFAVLPGRAPAAFTLTLTQTGGNVVAMGSGTLNLAALTLSGSGSGNAFLNASSATLYGGPATSTNFSYYTGGGLTGAASFGSGSFNAASTGSGDFVGINGASLRLYVPQGYVSGAALTDTDTYTGASLASLGFMPGTYTYAWGAGATADTLTVASIVPEPSSWVLLVAGLGLAVAARRHPRRLVPAFYQTPRTPGGFTDWMRGRL